MTTSFIRFAKPWLEYQQEFEDACNVHLDNLYDFWHDFWHTHTADKSDIPYWRNCIFTDSLAYVRQGLALHVVRLKLSHSNKNWRTDFEAFCKASPIGSAAYARKIIKAAMVTIELINHGFSQLPACVAQALPLAKFLGNSTDYGETVGETVTDKWREIISTAPSNHITAAHVQAVVAGEDYEKPTTIKVKKFKQNLADEARERGISQQELIEEILAERYQERSDEQAAEEDCSQGRSDEQAAPVPRTAAQEKILDELDEFFLASETVRSDTRSDSS